MRTDQSDGLPANMRTDYRQTECQLTHQLHVSVIWANKIDLIWLDVQPVLLLSSLDNVLKNEEICVCVKYFNEKPCMWSWGFYCKKHKMTQLLCSMYPDGITTFWISHRLCVTCDLSSEEEKNIWTHWMYLYQTQMGGTGIFDSL